MRATSTIHCVLCVHLRAEFVLRYLQPDTLELCSAEDSCTNTEKLKSKPEMFDSSGMVVEQFFASSVDGTLVPYFVIRKEAMPHDGSNCTLYVHVSVYCLDWCLHRLDAYGGFEISMLPGYSAGVGAGWLERGGVKVIANIRGGGEVKAPYRGLNTY